MESHGIDAVLVEGQDEGVKHSRGAGVSWAWVLAGGQTAGVLNPEEKSVPEADEIKIPGMKCTQQFSAPSIHARRRAKSDRRLSCTNFSLPSLSLSFCLVLLVSQCRLLTPAGYRADLVAPPDSSRLSSCQVIERLSLLRLYFVLVVR